MSEEIDDQWHPVTRKQSLAMSENWKMKPQDVTFIVVDEFRVCKEDPGIPLHQRLWYVAKIAVNAL